MARRIRLSVFLITGSLSLMAMASTIAHEQHFNIWLGAKVGIPISGEFSLSTILFGMLIWLVTALRLLPPAVLAITICNS